MKLAGAWGVTLPEPFHVVSSPENTVTRVYHYESRSRGVILHVSKNIPMRDQIWWNIAIKFL